MIEKNNLRISFDIGGVLSKYPEQFLPIVKMFQDGGAEVFIITDIPEHEKAVLYVQGNGYNVPADHVLNADYSKFNESCKEKLIEERKIDVHIDDHPGYCAHNKSINLFVWPDTSKPYYHESFEKDEDKLKKRAQFLEMARAAPEPGGMLAVAELPQWVVELQIEAMRKGFDLAYERAEIFETDGWHRTDPYICWEFAEKELEEEIEKLKNPGRREFEELP